MKLNQRLIYIIIILFSVPLLLCSLLFVPLLNSRDKRVVFKTFGFRATVTYEQGRAIKIKYPRDENFVDMMLDDYLKQPALGIDLSTIYQKQLRYNLTLLQ